MALTSLALVLTAALLHALWNALVKASDDGLVTAWGVLAGAAIVNVPIVVLLGLPDRNVWWVVVVSSVIHVGYNLFLVAAYRRADMAVVYPIARGVAPPIVALAGIAFLGDSISVVGIVGVALITAGLVTMVTLRSAAGIGWAVGTGLMIASYTFIDGFGVRENADSLTYIAAIFIIQSLGFTVIVAALRGPKPMGAVVSSQAGRLFLGGAASAAAYLLVMIAARTEPLGLVAGLRETSAVFGLILAHHFLGEKVTPHHVVAVAVIVVGAIGIALA